MWHIFFPKHFLQKNLQKFGIKLHVFTFFPTKGFIAKSHAIKPSVGKKETKMQLYAKLLEIFLQNIFWEENMSKQIFYINVFVEKIVCLLSRAKCFKITNLTFLKLKNFNFSNFFSELEKKCIFCLKIKYCALKKSRTLKNAKRSHMVVRGTGGGLEPSSPVQP